MNAIDLQSGDLIGALEVDSVFTVTTTKGVRVLITTTDGSEWDYAANAYVPATPRH